MKLKSGEWGVDKLINFFKIGRRGEGAKNQSKLGKIFIVFAKWGEDYGRESI